MSFRPPDRHGRAIYLRTSLFRLNDARVGGGVFDCRAQFKAAVLVDNFTHGGFDHRADFQQQPTAGFQTLCGLRHQSLDHFRAARAGDQRRTRFVIAYAGRQFIKFGLSDIRRIAGDDVKSLLRIDPGEQVALHNSIWLTTS